MKTRSVQTRKKFRLSRPKKPVTTQVATMFTAEYESAKRSQDREGTEVISAKKTMVKADPHVQVHAETILAKEDQKQAKAISILDNQGENRAPSRSDFSETQGVESASKSTRANSTQAKRSRPQQPKVEIMSAHLVPNSIQIGQPIRKNSQSSLLAISARSRKISC
ncbi:hypothetical protein CR513_10989, partial [Mucuna pruriens]